MGTVISTTHECGYPLLLEEIVERVDITTAEDIPASLRGKIRSDQLPGHLHRYREVGTLFYWYDGEHEAEREVKHCPGCSAPLPLYRRAGAERQPRTTTVTIERLRALALDRAHVRQNALRIAGYYLQAAKEEIIQIEMSSLEDEEITENTELYDAYEAMIEAFADEVVRIGQALTKQAKGAESIR